MAVDRIICKAFDFFLSVILLQLFYQARISSGLSQRALFLNSKTDVAIFTVLGRCAACFIPSISICYVGASLLYISNWTIGAHEIIILDELVRYPIIFFIYYFFLLS